MKNARLSKTIVPSIQPKMGAFLLKIIVQHIQNQNATKANCKASVIGIMGIASKPLVSKLLSLPPYQSKIVLL